MHCCGGNNCSGLKTLSLWTKGWLYLIPEKLATIRCWWFAVVRKLMNMMPSESQKTLAVTLPTEGVVFTFLSGGKYLCCHSILALLVSGTKECTHTSLHVTTECRNGSPSLSQWSWSWAEVWTCPPFFIRQQLWDAMCNNLVKFSSSSHNFGQFTGCDLAVVPNKAITFFSICLIHRCSQSSCMWHVFNFYMVFFK